MERKNYEAILKNTTPLEINGTISINDKYGNLFTAKQIESRSVTNNYVLKGMIPGEHRLAIKYKTDGNLQQTTLRQRRSRRSSFILKDVPRPCFRIRPNSKNLPPLNARNKDTLSKGEIILNKTLLDIPPPFTTSKWWSVTNGRTGETIFGKLEKEIREVASLTKLMVCITVIKVWKRLSIDLKSTAILVSYDAACITGTTAWIKEDDYLNIWDLLHGLMLPSGNDVAFLLCEYFGKLLKKTGNLRGIK